MQLIIYITVGYIIGIIWGLYLKINIVPIIFFTVGCIYLLQKKTNKLLNYKLYFIACILTIFISNVQTSYLENKFSNLYAGLDKVNAIGIITSEGKKGEYKTSYILKVESINGDSKYKGTYLNLYTKENIEIDYGKKVKLKRNIYGSRKKNKL